MKTTKLIIAITLYLLAALIYFLPLAIPHKIAAALLILFLFSIRSMPWRISVALFFSFCGDLAGSFKAGSTSSLPFMLQMGGFALAHIFYILEFFHLRRVLEAKLRVGMQRGNAFERNALHAALCIAVFICSLFLILPQIDILYMQIAVSAYAALISTMLCSALTCPRETGNAKLLLLKFGALLFVFSDLILAINMFVVPIPGQKYLIMIPYYAAQLLFFLYFALYPKYDNYAC